MQIILAAAQYEPSMSDWLNAIQQDPRYLVSMAICYWPWTLAIVLTLTVIALKSAKWFLRLIQSDNTFPDNSWGEEARAQIEERRAAEEKRAKAQTTGGSQQASDILRAHAEGIAPINDIVQDFIRTMRNAGSRKLQVKKENGHWERAIFFKSLRKGRWRIVENPEGSGRIVEVYTDGTWKYLSWFEGYESSGPSGDIYPSLSLICSPEFNGRRLTPDQYADCAKGIQGMLVKFLREHNIKLPES